MYKSAKLALVATAACITGLLTCSTRLSVKNNTFKTIVLYFDSMVYKRPQTESLLPKQTRSVYLEDYTDKDITKPITVEARGGGSTEPVTWSFAQQDLRDNMVLIFSKPKQQTLRLTIIKPNGTSSVKKPISQ